MKDDPFRREILGEIAGLDVKALGPDLVDALPGEEAHLAVHKTRVGVTCEEAIMKCMLMLFILMEGLKRHRGK